MQTISQNAITQGIHGAFNAVDISPSPDPFYYAPEDGTITAWGESGTCGLRLELTGATGRHGFCHNEYALVKVGDHVVRGQKLAKMGYTGLTVPDDVPAGTHVHWVIQHNGAYVYPPSLVNQSFIKQGDYVEPVFKDTNDVRVNGFGLYGIEKAGDDPALVAWVGKSKLEFFIGLGPTVVNNTSVMQKQLDAALAGGTLPAGTYLKVNKDDVKEVK